MRVNKRGCARLAVLSLLGCFLVGCTVADPAGSGTSGSQTTDGHTPPAGVTDGQTLTPGQTQPEGAAGSGVRTTVSADAPGGSRFTTAAVTRSGGGGGPASPPTRSGKKTVATTATRAGNANAGSSTTTSRVTTTKKTSSSTTTTTTRKQEDPTQAPPQPDGRLERQGFGFYGLDYQNNPEAFQEALDSNWVNTFFLGRSHHTIDTLLEGLRRIDRAGKTAWLNISEAMYIYYGTHTVLDDNWRQNLDFVMRRVKEEGLYRSVRGIYWDEPFLCKIDKQSFIRVTKYFRETYTDKGIFICFSVTPIVPSMWRPDYPVVELDAEAGRYLTDVAYDYYGDALANRAQFDRLTSELKRRMGRSDVRIWYVPCTMAYGGRTDELFSISHVNELYRRLQMEANPGGIMCYTYYTFPADVEALGNIGLDNLLAKDNPRRWKDLEYRLKTIGREIVQRRFARS